MRHEGSFAEINACTPAIGGGHGNYCGASGTRCRRLNPTRPATLS
jgi:hypothetical protein